MMKITINTDHAIYRTENDEIDYESVARELHRLADRIGDCQQVHQMLDTNGNESIHVVWEDEAE